MGIQQDIQDYNRIIAGMEDQATTSKPPGEELWWIAGIMIVGIFIWLAVNAPAAKRARAKLANSRLSQSVKSNSGSSSSRYSGSSSRSRTGQVKIINNTRSAARVRIDYIVDSTGRKTSINSSWHAKVGERFYPKRRGKRIYAREVGYTVEIGGRLYRKRTHYVDKNGYIILWT